MPQTPRGIIYPDHNGHTRTWEHWQAEAETTDAALDKVHMTALSTAMPPHLEGRLVYQTDLDRLVVSDGVTWRLVNTSPSTNGAWQSWTIANTQGWGFQANYTARFARIGQTVHAVFRAAVGAQAGGNVKINLPLPWRAGMYDADGSGAIGQGMYFNPGVTRSPFLVSPDAYTSGARDAVGLWFTTGNNSQVNSNSAGNNTLVGWTCTYETDAA